MSILARLRPKTPPTPTEQERILALLLIRVEREAAALRRLVEEAKTTLTGIRSDGRTMPDA